MNTAVGSDAGPMPADANADGFRQKKGSDINVRLIENAVLVGIAGRWMSFPTWEHASEYVEARIEALKRIRLESQE